MRRFVFLLAAAPLLGSCTPETAPRADLILTGGRVITLAEADPQPAPTAVAIAAGRILYVGDDQGALDLAAQDARIVDLAGGVVIPGFADAHCHLYGLGTALAQIDLVGTADAAACAGRVRAEAAALPDLEWLQGRGWDQNDWPGQEYPGKEVLDAVAPDRPVYLRRIDGHAAWVNSEALRRAGIDRDTPDPEGGAILRGADGEPTGILVDNAADLVGDIIPEVDDAEIRRRILLASKHCLKYGITGVHEAGMDWRRAGIYREMAEAGELPLRVYGMYDDIPETLEQAFASGPVAAADGMLRIGGVKLYADGALGSRGALLLNDYADDPGNRGLAVTPREHLLDVARRALATGFQVCTHAIGDGANRLMLDVYEEALGESSETDHRWRIEHAQILDPEDLPRFAELGVIASMQPVHCTSDMDWAGQRLGEDRLAGAYAWRSLLRSGAQLCFGTDFPIERVDPRAGLYAARTRMHQDGTPAGGWRAGETIDARAALELYTAGGAYASFAEGELGRVAPGFRADLTVLSGDPVACEPAEALDLQVRLTVVNGQVAYAAE